ncbi:hypothetical protein FBR02_05955 [Anaerolineae bacterium CFX9]|nr:hypothetical protein [Anaerolineae bacterium CFX9]
MSEQAQTKSGIHLATRSILAASPQTHFVFWNVLRILLILSSISLSLITFDQVSGLQYTPNVLLPWLLSVTAWCAAWMIAPQRIGQSRVTGFPFRVPQPDIGIIALILLMLIAACALLFRLDEIPYEMHGDQGHYALDAYNIVQGERTMYEFRNTGREQFHSYVIAFIHSTFGTPYLLSVKLSSVLAALIALPGLYWFGVTVGGKRTALFAAAFACVATWFIIFGRVGYRMTWIAPASAWTLAALWYGVKTDQRWCFVMAGLVLGLGWHTHVAFRLMPFAIFTALVLIVWRAQPEKRWRFVVHGVALLGAAGLVAMPLFSFAWRRPEQYFFRTTMFLDTDSVIPLTEVLRGLYLTLRMFLLGGDPQQANNYLWRAPTAAPILALCFYVGLALSIIRAVRKRDALSLWLPVGLIFGFLPSALAIDSPHELPSARRAYSAFPIVMVMAGMIPVLLLDYAQRRHRLTAKAGISLLAVGLVLVNGWVELRNYFELYPLHYDVSPHRFTAETIQTFWERGVREEDTYFVYSDAFLDFEWVAMSLERPEMFSTQLIDSDTLAACRIPVPEGRSLLFIVGPNETEDQERLRTCYPTHTEQRLDSPYDAYPYEIMTFQALSRAEAASGD